VAGTAALGLGGTDVGPGVARNESGSRGVTTLDEWLAPDTGQREKANTRKKIQLRKMLISSKSQATPTLPMFPKSRDPPMRSE
jgi:hypothetical protein